MLVSTRLASTMFVATPPGCTQVALTGAPSSSSSIRSASVKPRTANFVALYALCVGIAMRPNRLDVLTTCPSPDARRCGRNACVPCTTPQKLMPTIHSRSARLAVSALAASDTPALLKIRFTLPCSARTKSAHANTASRSATSTRRVLVRTPCFAHAAAVPASPTSLTSASATSQPRRASSTARLRPIPEPAPVIAATLPEKPFIRRPPVPLPSCRRRVYCGVGRHHFSFRVS
ncbi:hypothetical protein FEP65_06337 [Burkholderia multivorans]|nr:hypothetical protein [Burkholderia multivorans]